MTIADIDERGLESQRERTLSSLTVVAVFDHWLVGSRLGTWIGFVAETGERLENLPRFLASEVVGWIVIGSRVVRPGRRISSYVVRVVGATGSETVVSGRVMVLVARFKGTMSSSGIGITESLGMVWQRKGFTTRRNIGLRIRSGRRLLLVCSGSGFVFRVNGLEKSIVRGKCMDDKIFLFFPLSFFFTSRYYD